MKPNHLKEHNPSNPLLTAHEAAGVVGPLGLVGYLPSMLVNGSAMRRVDAVTVPVDPLDQAVVSGPSDRVQPWGKPPLKERDRDK